MNNNEKLEVSKLWFATAKFYDKVLDQDMLNLLTSDVNDLNAQDVINALNLYRKDKKNKFWPKSSDVRELIIPSFSEESIGRDTSAKIIAAIPRYGYNNAIEARSFIGEFGWNIVKRLGGWSFLCENVGLTINNSALAAQIRDLASDHAMHGSSAIDNKILNLHNEPKHRIEQPIALIENKEEQISYEKMNENLEAVKLLLEKLSKANEN